MTAAVAGEVQMTFANYSDAIPWMQSGRLRALAVTSAKRFPAAPNLATVAETLPGYEVEGWSGLVAPAGTPASIIERIAGILRPVLGSPQMVARMERIGAVAGGDTPAAFSDEIKRDAGRWVEFVKRTGIKVTP